MKMIIESDSDRWYVHPRIPNMPSQMEGDDNNKQISNIQWLPIDEYGG